MTVLLISYRVMQSTTFSIINEGHSMPELKQIERCYIVVVYMKILVKLRRLDDCRMLESSAMFAVG